MLVLTRKRMEKLYIGGDICVTVVRLEGGQVRLGIDAPRHVPVVRAELRQRDEAAAAAEMAAEMAAAEMAAAEAAAALSRLGGDRIGVVEESGSVTGRWPVRPIPVTSETPAPVPASVTGRVGGGAQSSPPRSGSRKR